MINPNKPLFRWGPIPGRLIAISHWTAGWHINSLSMKYAWPESYTIYHKQRMLFINNLGPLHQSGGKAFRDIFLARKDKKYWLIWQKVVSDLFKFCKHLSAKILRKLSNQELETEWYKFNKLVYNFWEIGILPEMSAYGAEPLLKKALTKERLSANRINSAFSVLSAPIRPLFYQEEEIALLQLAKKLNKNDFDLLLTKHQQKFYWLANSYYRTEILSNNYFLRRVKEKGKLGVRKELKKLSSYFKDIKKKKTAYLTSLKNRRLIKNLANKLSYCIWWQDQRKKYIFQYLHYLDLFLKEFARRSRVPTRLLDYAWPYEVSANVSPLVKQKLIERRNNNFGVFFSSKKAYCIYGKKAEKLMTNYWEEKISKSVGNFSGLVIYGSQSILQGQVFIIKKYSDIKNFPQGRILVAAMTSPDYIQAIKKSLAVITDTGGITCHAAIVSRELKKLCIVGTKFATRILKTGDMVEVDTNKGIIKKL
ncbi:MAG: PEP-utilizing enzyme [Patescibacteria group bacterium]